MLPRRHRLPLRFFRHQLQKSRHSISTLDFTLYYSSRESLESPSRLAIIISKKLISSAVKRNLFRRQLQYHLHSLLPTIPTGHDFLILPKPSSLRLNFDQQRESLERLFSKINVN